MHLLIPNLVTQIQQDLLKNSKYNLNKTREAGPIIQAANFKAGWWPRKEQHLASQRVFEHFAHGHDRAQVIAPPGSGKTLTALLSKEKLQPKLTLVALPSLSLIKQFKDEWSLNAISEFKYLCVCSDKKTINDDDISLAEVDSRATTDPHKIRNFLEQNKEEKNIVIFSTYHSLPRISEAIKGSDIKFDLAIADEAHRTALNKNNLFGFIHSNENIPIAQRLYMTATPRILSPEMKDSMDEEEIDLIADMSDPKTFGKEVYKMTFKEAIDKGIISDYKIVAVGLSDEEINKETQGKGFTEEELKTIGHNIALKKISKKYNLKKTISFHDSVLCAENFTAIDNKLYPDCNSLHISGYIQMEKRREILEKFRKVTKANTSNAKLLKEGVNIKEVDGVYLADPMKSTTAITQAGGRALRKTPGKKYGYIIVPIFHKKSENIEDAIEESSFNYLTYVIRQFSDQDERLSQEISLYKRTTNKGKFGTRDIPHLMLEGVEHNPDLKKAIFDQIVSKSTKPGLEKALRAYELYKELGNKRPTRARARHKLISSLKKMGLSIEEIKKLKIPSILILENLSKVIIKLEDRFSSDDCKLKTIDHINADIKKHLSSTSFLDHMQRKLNNGIKIESDILKILQDMRMSKQLLKRSPVELAKHSYQLYKELGDKIPTSATARKHLTSSLEEIGLNEEEIKKLQIPSNVSLQALDKIIISLENKFKDDDNKLEMVGDIDINYRKHLASSSFIRHIHRKFKEGKKIKPEFVEILQNMGLIKLSLTDINSPRAKKALEFYESIMVQARTKMISDLKDIGFNESELTIPEFITPEILEQTIKELKAKLKKSDAYLESDINKIKTRANDQLCYGFIFM